MKGLVLQGADVAFLRAAFAISSGAVYSLHKSSTRAHIQKVYALACCLYRGPALCLFRSTWTASEEAHTLRLVQCNSPLQCVHIAVHFMFKTRQ